MFSALKKYPAGENTAENQISHKGLSCHLPRIIAVESCHHRHPCVGTIRHRLHLCAIPQLIQQDEIGCQAPYRLTDAHRLRITAQDITALQRVIQRQLSPLIHHRHAVVTRG